jgi:RNA polymerase sigma-70 factor (ECF subfamily)
VKNQADADDVTQEVFIELFRSMNRFRGESRLSTWIYRISVNKSLEHLRRKKQKKWFGLWNKPDEGDAIEKNLPDFDHPGVLAENRERAKILAWALDKLPENQRIAYTLHKIEGLGYQEIAEVIQVSLSAVESLMHRARHNLQKHLKNYYES